MNSLAKSDMSLASCMHCATQLPPHARVCPSCGEDPLVDSGIADASWFDDASVSTTSDPVLETMMAIAAGRPGAANSAAVSFLHPGPPALVQEPSFGAPQRQASALAPASAKRPLPPWRRRVLSGVAAVSALAALTAVLLNANRMSVSQRVEPKAVASFASTELSPARDGVRNDGEREVVPMASPEPPSQALPQASTPARPEEDARTIATALGLGERREAAPPIAPPAAAQNTISGGTATPPPCSEALAALALCRTP